MRPVHISHDRKRQCLFASTNRGLILKMDEGMNRLASSEPVYGLNNLYVMAQDNDFVYARDIVGKLARWHKDSMTLDVLIDLCNWSDPAVADVPNVSHGLFIRDKTVYVSMPQGRMGRFRQSDLGFLGLSTYEPKALFECFDFAGPSGHFAVDFSGYLYRGDIDGHMELVSRVAHGACHQVIYDRRFDRYWITDDYHCGLALFEASRPKEFRRIPLTTDDVEWMSFNEDQSEVLVACFDRYVYRIVNELEPKVVGKFGPFKYQVNHVEWSTPDKSYALTESGEIYLINPKTGEMIKGPTGTNAVWDIQPAGEEKFWVAFEDGHVRKVEVENANIRTLREKDLGLSMIRRVSPSTDGGVFALSTLGYVTRWDQNLDCLWTFETQGLLRDLARHDGKLLFCSERGEVTCLDEKTGRMIWRQQFDKPLWTITVDPKGECYWAASRLCEKGDQGKESSGIPADIIVGDTQTGIEIRREKRFGNIKRMKWTDDEHILMNGNGEVATSLVRASDFTTICKWEEFQLNTCEASLLHGSRLYTTTYGYQLNTFDVKGKILESAFPFADYATSLAAVDETRILAGGRGAFLSLFFLREGLPFLAVTRSFN